MTCTSTVTVANTALVVQHSFCTNSRSSVPDNDVIFMTDRQLLIVIGAFHVKTQQELKID